MRLATRCDCCAAARIACIPPSACSPLTTSWRERVVETRVRFRNLSNEEIGNYLASGEWKGKAGGYAIQGIAGSFVVKMVGSYTNVVGLPLTEVVSLLQGEGFPVSHLWLSKAEVETE